eukprot:1184197-Prorocentrum_minimum.AAC.1
MEISRFGLVAGSVQEFSPDGGCGGGQLEEFRQVLLISKVHPDRFHLSYEEVHRRQDFVANISDQVASVRKEIDSDAGTASRKSREEPSTTGSSVGAGNDEAELPVIRPA